MASLEEAAADIDEGRGPEALALASAEASTMRAALARLTLERREVIVLKFYLGHDNREIAAIMGKPRALYAPFRCAPCEPCGGS